MSQVTIMTMQSINTMHANEFRKKDFRRLLESTEALGLNLCYKGELVGYDSKLILLDPIDVDKAETGFFMTGEECIKALSAILELCAGFVQSQKFDFALLAEMTQKYCSITVRYDSKLIQEGTKIKYFRAEQLGPIPKEFGRLYDSYEALGFEVVESTPEAYDVDSQWFDFNVPSEMGALLTLLIADKNNQWSIDKVPHGLRCTAILRALDDFYDAREAYYYSIAARDGIREYFW